MIIVAFVVLGGVGRQMIAQAPPIASQVVTEDEREITKRSTVNSRRA